jgi:TRAP-type C4-dicarboxylate transport system substrate-binding protein
MAERFKEGHFVHRMAVDFINRIENGSNGRIEIELYPGDLLGSYKVHQESVSAGTLELAIPPPLPTVDSRWDIGYVGFQFYAIDQWWDSRIPGGWLYDTFNMIGEASNWAWLGLVPSGGCQLVISNDLYPINEPGGRKIRIAETKARELRFDALGYKPVIMPWAEIVGAITTGVIDCASGVSGPELGQMGDSWTYGYAYVDELGTGRHFVMNKQLFASLDPADQELIQKSCTETVTAFLDMWADDQRSAWAELPAWQKVITYKDGDDWARAAEIVRAKEWSGLEEPVGKDLMDLARSKAADLPWGKTLDEMGIYPNELFTEAWLIEHNGEIIYPT